ncbi:MAG: cobyric acid synthase [Pseudomonadota bacterium]
MTDTPAIMIQGTGSNVGKSLIVAGLCRLFARQGLRVRPFKPQNMSNNAAATPDGGEIGRAQALQARAAGVLPKIHMNPVLLKPESETGSQVIVQGRRWATLAARDYGRRKAELLPAVMESYRWIAAEAELVIVEGAGSPAEVNLRRGDIANMGFAEAADVPVALVGDIDRGGVIASLVGCHAVLETNERARIKAFLINRFRGDPTLFANGMDVITTRTGWRGLGIVPHFPQAQTLPAEDSSDLDTPAAPNADGPIHVVALRLPRIANFDDLDPLRLDPNVRLTMLQPGEVLPTDTDLVIVPGSKATLADLKALIAEGWDIDIKAHVRRGGCVLGLCGGYQMLGNAIDDPNGIEGIRGRHAGLGLLDVETTLTGDKSVHPITGTHPASGTNVSGYEIHLGETTGPDCARPYLNMDNRPDGASSTDGRILGTYVHGLFASDRFRRAFLARLRDVAAPGFAYEQKVDATLDLLADHLSQSLDVEALLKIANMHTS